LYKNNLWLTGNGGLTGLNLLNDEISEISTDDGLPSDVIHQADLLDGYFYLGTQDGLAIINPDFQVSHFISPRIDVTSFNVLTDSTSFGNLSSGAEITLSEKQNSFRIDFTVLDFNLPEKNRYKFRFFPIEKEWQKPVGENFLIFNSLPAGDYRFELIGSNADQIWSTEPFVINIRIVPPFYKTTWFYIVCISVIILGGIIFSWLRIRSEHMKQELLEKIIRERTAEIQSQRAELLDSITYAQRIQKAIFVGERLLKENLPDSFIYNKPKDKISGDFFWIGKHKDLLIVFAGDCTGHGVPGAMLSIIGTSLLNKIVYEENTYLPGEILTRLNHLFYNQLSLDQDNIRDGMDASVITLNLVNKNVYYAGARLDGIFIEDNKMRDMKAERHSIGEHLNTEFTSQNIVTTSGSQFYIYSDGIKDQHGGANGKKLSGKRFREILLKASALPFDQQRQFISTEVKNWKGDLPQTDDMILIGFKL
jgi:serine phosphatase RsbU (regulator of sigma subunit)